MPARSSELSDRGARRLPRRGVRAEAVRPARGRALHRVVHAGRRRTSPRCTASPSTPRHPVGGHPCSMSSRCSRPSPTCRPRPASSRRSSTHPAVAARLEQTGRRMEVMLGYSDSSKDVGPVAANLALYEAQAAISAWAREEGIELTLFHGRGGALGRGGGPAELRDPRPAAALGRRPLQAHRAGRGDLRPVRRPRHRDAPHRPGRRRHAARLVADDRAPQQRGRGAVRRRRGDDGCGIPRALLLPREGTRLRAVVRHA